MLWRYGPSSGPGELDHPSLALPIGHGLIAINDDYRHRVVIVRIKNRRIVWQYGHTDVAGRGPGYLHTPDGLDLLKTADAQRMPAVRALLAPPPKTKGAAAPALASGPSPLHVRQAGYCLPAPVERAVAVAAGSGILIAGGLDAGGSSTNGVFRLDPASGRLTSSAPSPSPSTTRRPA